MHFLFCLMGANYQNFFGPQLDTTFTIYDSYVGTRKNKVSSSKIYLRIQVEKHSLDRIYVLSIKLLIQLREASAMRSKAQFKRGICHLLEADN